VEDASDAQNTTGVPWSPDRPGDRQPGDEDLSEGLDEDGFLGLQPLDAADADDLTKLEGALHVDSSDDGEHNLWDLILGDPSLFIEDELNEVSGQLIETIVADDHPEKSVEQEIHEEGPDAVPVPENDRSDGDSSPSMDARGDSSGMPDHPASASDEVEEEKTLHLPVDEEAVPGAFPRDRVVAMMLRRRLVTYEQVDQARELAKEHPREVLWRVLAIVPGIDRDAVYATAATVYAFTEAAIRDGKPNPDFVRLVMNTFPEDKRDQLLEMRVIPYEAEVGRGGSHRLIFVSHDPARPEVQRLLQELKVGRVEIRYAPESDIAATIAELFPKENEYLQRMSDDPFAVDLGANFDADEDLIDEEALEAEISRSTLINLFEAALVEAVRQGASDIHIYPNALRQVEIHFRTDGRLRKWHTEEKVHPEAFLAVVKDNSVNVDRFERDAAQDGFVQRRIDDALIRFRVSVLPIATERADVRAESIVIRVLDDRKVLTDLRKLGMLDVALERFDKAIRQPHGMVILTGPTGSGKSTTLVAALHQVVTPDVNVLTVEDPVEYIIKGVRQIKLNHKLNLEQALRAILRHDPDIVMVGEMRDKDTAELAIKLANTGHLTFSTLHTNDAPSAVSRLYKMGIEPFLISYAINLVVAQRLIRTVCPTCKKVDDAPDRVLLKSLGFSDAEIDGTTFYNASYEKSCRTCKGIGYKGRRALCETLYFSPQIRHIIVEAGESIDEDEIRDQAVKEGMLTLQDSARELVKMGETSVEEMIRVTASE
jgi:type IV pilus assembly protein PilB